MISNVKKKKSVMVLVLIGLVPGKVLFGGDGCHVGRCFDLLCVALGGLTVRFFLFPCVFVAFS